MTDNKKRIYGLIGYPVEHSLSPDMHNAAFKALGMDNCEYEKFKVEPDDLGSFLDSLEEKSIYGLNVTVPHKIKAREILEKRFPFDKNAKEIMRDMHYVQISGAINTIKKDGDELKYWNTDAPGFLKSLESDLEFNPKDKKVLLIGCGGAARAIIASLSWVQVGIDMIYIYDINNAALDSAEKYLSSASDHLERFSRDNLKFISSSTEIPDIIEDCDLLINATTVGMREKDGSAIDKKLLHKGLSVFDVVYKKRNRKTQLIKDAEELGLPAVDGSGMLLYQGILSFEYWTGKPAPQKEMKTALSQALSG